MDAIKAIIIKNVKNNLRLLRETNGLTMREVAKAMNVKENTYRIWEDENKDSIPKPESLTVLASMYNVSVDFLLRTEAKNYSQIKTFINSADSIYGDKYLNELSPEEKITVMKIRRMSKADRQKVFETIMEILGENEINE